LRGLVEERLDLVIIEKNDFDLHFHQINHFLTGP